MIQFDSYFLKWVVQPPHKQIQPPIFEVEMVNQIYIRDLHQRWIQRFFKRWIDPVIRGTVKWDSKGGFLDQLTCEDLEKKSHPHLSIWVLNQKYGDFSPKMDGENKGRRENPIF